MHCTSFTELMGWNPVQAWNFFRCYFWNHLSCVHNCNDDSCLYIIFFHPAKHETSAESLNWKGHDIYLTCDTSMTPYSASSVLLTSVPSNLRTSVLISSRLKFLTSSLVINPLSLPPSQSNIYETKNNYYKKILLIIKWYSVCLILTITTLSLH